MTDVLLELEECLPKLAGALEVRDIADSLRNVAEMLNGLSDGIERLKAVFDVARMTGFDAGTRHEQMDDLLDSVKELGTAMLQARTATQLDDIQFVHKDFVRELANIDRMLKGHWGRIVQRDYVPLKAIGGLLQRIEDTADLGKKMVKCGQDAVELRETIRIPELRDEISRLEKRRGDLKQMRSAATGDTEIDLFLDAIANRTATLEMFTTQVQEWLSKNEALDKFVISARSS